MPTANFFGHKADSARRIFDAVLHDVRHLQRKPETHIEFLHFGLASITNQASIRSKQVRQQFTDNTRHIVAVFIEVGDTLQRKPARTERRLLPERKLRHAVTHFNRHRTHRSGIDFGQFLQQRNYHMRMQAKVHVRVFRLTPTFRERLLKFRNSLFR